MSVYLQLLWFEVKHRLMRKSSLAYFGLFAFLAYMIAIAFAGAFKGASVSLGLSNKLALNSPLALNMLICLLGYIGLLVSAPIFGQSINKDYESKFNQILFATPLTKWRYFSLRYFGSLISSTAILSSIAVGIWIATLMPFVDQTLIAPNHLWFYVAPYLTNLIPNLIIFGGLFIAVVSFAKKMAPVYVASIAVFTGWLIANSLTSDLENKWLAAMVEPFGLEATSNITRYWSIAEQSTRVVPLTGVLLTNRLAWGAFGLLLTVLAYWVFNPYELGREKRKAAPAEPTRTSAALELPLVHLVPDSWRVLVNLARMEFRQAFRNIYFLMILLCGVLYLIGVGTQVGKMFGTETYPVTYDVLDTVGGMFGLFVLILITYYAGDLVWKDRDLHAFEIVDSKPVPNRYLYLSKLGALFSLQVFLAFVTLVCCVLVQTFKGYHHYEWGVYFSHLVIYGLPPKLLICVLALFVHTMVPSKYVGHAVMVLYFLLLSWLPSLGLNHELYLLGHVPREMYSDMNGFGTAGYKFFTLFVYWGFLYGAMAIATLLFWRRGSVITFKDRWQELRDRWKPVHGFGLATSLVGFAAMGGFVFYNTNILNPYHTKAYFEQSQVDYEHKYSAFNRAPQPEVTSVTLHTDIFPQTQTVHELGEIVLRNKTDKPIERVLMQISEIATVGELKFDVPVTIEDHDERQHAWIYRFNEPLKPGQEIHFTYRTAIVPHGFSNVEFSKIVVGNGTFIHSGDFTPVFGYNRDQEISDDKTRHKYNLPERPRLYDVNDKEALQKTYISPEGTWIKFEATVSTSPDQIAVAPGYLVKEWTENGRRYFHYKMDAPILNFYAILSARYQVVHDKWKDVNIEVYYHPGHTYDLQRMIASAKKSLAYYTENFSPYQFKQFRIFEFPRYEHYAQAFPNTIPYSEALGFVAKIKDNDPESIDYPFYVTAHEMAHQWWAHQVIGAPVQGATMLSESLAQYSAYMVQEHEYGPKQMKKFLKYELDKYLFGRSREQKKELPVDLNENQLYIHYQKGGLAFYALKDYFGEPWVNRILAGFLKDHAFKEAPFPRAVDLVERFRAAAPDDKKYIVDDLFNTVTLYNNRADSATAVKDGDKYQVTLVANSQKLRADELGNEKEIAMNDLVDIGVYGEDGQLMYLEKHRVKGGRNEIQVTVDHPPAKAGIDPLNKLIDRVSDDNVTKVTIEAGPSLLNR